MKLHYAGQIGASGFGWATCNNALHRELGKLCELVAPGDADVIFQPIADHALNPSTPHRAKINIGYTFFEFPLDVTALHNSEQYDLIFCGSTWCLDRLRDVGVKHGKLLIQGVDRDIFKPQPAREPDGQFRIFSGGKFEYRKGQDLVLEAFNEFHSIHWDSTLITAWHNPWPKLAEALLKTLNQKARDGWKCPIVALPALTQSELARVMANTDVGLFPNRCEGGTNLVLMEYACCGRRVVANAKTGHADIASAISYEIPATNDENHWAVQDVADIVNALELAYECRNTVEHWSMSAHRSTWTWEAAAEKIANHAHSILHEHGRRDMMPV